MLLHLGIVVKYKVNNFNNKIVLLFCMVKICDKTTKEVKRDYLNWDK